MQFFNTAEKIKNLRKQLGMKQQDLKDAAVTRSFISMVETGKRVPSKDIAENIANKFRCKAKELGISLDIGSSYILRSAREDAELYCVQELQNINKVDAVKDIIKIAEEYKLENVLAKAYLYLGNNYFNNRNYVEAHLYYMNALDYYKNTNKENLESYLYNRLGNCKLNRLEYLEALSYFNLANYYSTIENDINFKKMSIYNIALCNRKLNKLDTALEYIDMYLSICDKEKDFKFYVYANILKAICYEAKKLGEISIDISLSLIKEFTNASDPLLAYIYNNLGTFYLNKGIFNKSLDFFNKSQSIREIVDTYNLSHTLIEKSFVYIKQNLYDQAIDILTKGLDLASKNNDFEYILKGYYALADIYTCIERSNDAENIYVMLINLLKNPDNLIYKNHLTYIYSKLSYIYLEQNNNYKLKESILVIQNLSFM